MKLTALTLLAAGIVFPASRLERFALVLEDKPLAERLTSRKDLRTAAAQDARQQILDRQAAVRSALVDKGVRVIGANQLLANVVFVEGPRERAAEFEKLPGVARVERLAPLKLHLGKALDLMNVPAAWSVVNGPQNAGAGVKIAILDTGIDITHPGLQEGSLQYPERFPKCMQDRGDCAFVNRKVIVARSYVSLLVGADDPHWSRPDDLSPRDRVGHGTAVAMVAAGMPNTGPAGTIQGVAPGAWLGNYKIFGSPGVNGQYTNDAALLQALEDAIADEMDIANVSLGAPAVWGPLDRGATCQKQGNAPCDWRAAAIENAARLGLTVVVSAGNDGEYGLRSDVPAYNSIQTPGTAPSAITVGAITNSHILYQTIQVEGPNVPANLRTISTRFGDGPVPAGPITGPLVDVTRLGDDGTACLPLGNGTLTGAIALIQRGGCQQVTKIQNAYRSGAIGVILYQQSAEGIFRLRGLDATPIPAVLVGARLGGALKTYASQNPGATATLDPALVSVPATADENVIATWSSRGPSIGENAMKPEVVAVGTDLYTATQRYDPNGEMYDASGYTAAQGTSFAAPIVAGVAAMVKQRNPGFRPAEIKSAVVNTARDDVRDFGSDGRLIPAALLDIGAGRINAEAAVRTNVTAEPATISFGIWQSARPGPQTVALRNHSGGSLTLRISVIRPSGSDALTIRPSATQLTVGAGQAVQVRLDISDGNRPRPGAYEGFIQIDGGASVLKIPYVYFVPDGVLHNLIPLEGDGFVASVGTEVALTFKAIDRLGLPIANLPVAFRTTIGNGRIVEEGRTTDSLGIGFAYAELGDQLGEQEFTVKVGTNPSLEFPFWGRARLRPAINSGGITNLFGSTARGIVPGSYIEIYGRGLSEVTRVFHTPYLPLAIAGVSVSFDVPGQNLSLPGRLHFVSDGQVNVQVPWELEGASNVQVKVSIGDSSGNLVTVPVAAAAPVLHEVADPSGRVFAAALDEGFRLVGSSNPAKRGSTIQFYAHGLGAVDFRPPSGEPSPTEPLARTRVQPSVTIGGRPAEVLFSGLAPGYVGLYQVNVRVPADAPAGVQPVVLTSSGIASKAVPIPVE